MFWQQSRKCSRKKTILSCGTSSDNHNVCSSSAQKQKKISLHRKIPNQLKIMPNKAASLMRSCKMRLPSIKHRCSFKTDKFLLFTKIVIIIKSGMRAISSATYTFHYIFIYSCSCLHFHIFIIPSSQFIEKFM